MTDSLETLLDQVHAAALTADFTALVRLVPAVEAASAGFDPTRDPLAARRIGAKAQRNAACLDAARRGLRAAGRRLADLRDIGLRLRTYDRNGQAAEILLPVHPTRRF